MFEGRQEAVTYLAAAVFDQKKSGSGSRPGVPAREVAPYHESGSSLVNFAAILQMKQHADQHKSALMLKQEVCDWGILNATKAAKQLECHQTRGCAT
eukprot:3431652-Amphidinium_carterae.4